MVRIVTKDTHWFFVNTGGMSFTSVTTTETVRVQETKTIFGSRKRKLSENESVNSVNDPGPSRPSPLLSTTDSASPSVTKKESSLKKN
ncbi:hypothetical protein J6590_060783 [Homalodisca vitripennis]|nr:hypothetical protein J6590_060783 [Homalodisca vitripennis]